MELNRIEKPVGANRKTKRVGRGTGSGHGTTACRGSKGQRCRAGYSSKPYWEGGQMPLYRGLGKSGFTNIFKKKYEILNLDDLERLGLDKIDINILKEKKLVSCGARRLKILGRGKLTRAIEISAHKASKSALKAVEAAKGKIVIIEEKKFLREARVVKKNVEEKK